MTTQAMIQVRIQVCYLITDNKGNYIFEAPCRLTKFVDVKAGCYHCNKKSSSSSLCCYCQFAQCTKGYKEDTKMRETYRSEDTECNRCGKVWGTKKWGLWSEKKTNFSIREFCTKICARNECAKLECTLLSMIFLARRKQRLFPIKDELNKAFLQLKKELKVRLLKMGYHVSLDDIESHIIKIIK